MRLGLLAPVEVDAPGLVAEDEVVVRRTVPEGELLAVHLDPRRCPDDVPLVRWRVRQLQVDTPGLGGRTSGIRHPRRAGRLFAIHDLVASRRLDFPELITLARVDVDTEGLVAPYKARVGLAGGRLKRPGAVVVAAQAEPLTS